MLPKIFQALSTLSKQQLKHFGNFIQSPYFNKNKLLYVLYDLLLPHHPNYSLVNKETLFAHLFEQQLYKDETLRLLYSDLYSLFEQFLVQQQLEQNKSLEQWLLFEGLKDASLNQSFWQQYAKFSKQNVGVFSSSPTLFYLDDYLYQHLCRDTAYQYSLVLQQNIPDLSLQTLSKGLDTYYVAAKLRYSCAMLVSELISANKYTDIAHNDLVLMIEKTPDLLQVPIINAYYCLLQLLNNSNQQNFEAWLALLHQNKQLSPFDLRQLYQGGLIYCQSLVRHGNAAGYSQFFSLYQQFLASKLIFVDNVLSVAHFKNLVTLGLLNQDWIWTREFIEQYKKHLPVNERENEYCLSLARWYFYQNDYLFAQQALLKVPFSTVYQQIACKTLLLQCYYELSETEPFTSLMANFKDLLKRTKEVSESDKAAYYRFLSTLNLLYRTKTQKQKLTTHDVQHLQIATAIVERKWLTKKMDDLL